MNDISCHYFIVTKKRNCNIKCIPGKNYCVEHSYVLKDESVRKRVPCPLDSKHSCYEDQIDKHVKKCNARLELRPSYFEENINCGEKDLKHTPEKILIKNLPKEELFTVLFHCEELYKAYSHGLNCYEILFHSCLEEAANDPKNGATALKHLKQQASLVSHMEKLQVLENNNCFIEFGAGKGGLSHWVKKAVEQKQYEGQYILVDKSSVRYKMDIHNKNHLGSSYFERLKIDIQNLNLAEVPSLDHNKPVVTFGKHLCGNATDYMLRCVVKTSQKRKSCNSLVCSVHLATCCHHRCDWTSYVGKRFFTENGFSPEQFNILCLMSSWGSCGIKAVDDPSYDHPYYGKLKPQEREIIGFHAKILIDLGRKKYLEENGFDFVKLVHFVEKSCTPENVCILATKTRSS